MKTIYRLHKIGVEILLAGLAIQMILYSLNMYTTKYTIIWASINFPFCIITIVNGKKIKVLASLERQINSLQHDINTTQEIIDSGYATQHDIDRLNELNSQLKPLKSSYDEQLEKKG